MSLAFGQHWYTQGEPARFHFDLQRRTIESDPKGSARIVPPWRGHRLSVWKSHAVLDVWRRKGTRMRSALQRVPGIIALVALLSLVGAAGVGGQGATTAQDQLDLSGAIHEGTCGDPADSNTYQVGDFIRIQESEIVGSQDIELTLRAQQTLQTEFDDLFGTEAPDYAFLVIDNTDPDGAPVACGALGGVQVNGQLVIGITSTDDASDDEELVGVAVFGNTQPTGPTTQPAQTPGQLPVHAYVSEEALTPDPVTPTVVAPTPTPPPPPPPASPTAAPSTPIPTQEPTIAPTEEPTMAPTEEPTQAPTESPTQAPTEEPTQMPTQAPTQAPPTIEPTEEDD